MQLIKKQKIGVVNFLRPFYGHKTLSVNPPEVGLKLTFRDPPAHEIFAQKRQFSKSISEAPRGARKHLKVDFYLF